MSIFNDNLVSGRRRLQPEL